MEHGSGDCGATRRDSTCLVFQQGLNTSFTISLSLKHRPPSPPTAVGTWCPTLLSITQMEWAALGLDARDMRRYFGQS
jgi:hypothetical protein